MRYWKRGASAFVLLAIVLSAFLPGARAAQLPGPAAQAAPEPVVVRLYFDTRADLDWVAAHYDVWQVQHDPGAGPAEDRGYAIVMLSLAEYEQLLAAGYRMEIDDYRTAQLLAPPSIPNYPCYRTVEETYAALQSLAATYPSLVELSDIGDSWDKTMPGGLDGYDLWALRITNEANPGPKPRFFLMAEIHAREMTTAETATRTAEYILARYGTDPTITFYVDYHEIYIVPMTNPDGRKIAEGGTWWRKNVDSDDGCTDPNNWGTDLNRNYSFKWDCCGGGDDDPCGAGYHGPYRSSEPETQAITGTILSLFPDQNGPNGDDEVPPAAPADATGIMITLHSAAGAVLWPWGFTPTPAPNGAQLQAIGTRLAAFGNYIPMQSYNLYLTDGTTDDWSYGKLGIASFTIEMGRFFFENCTYMDYTVYPNNRDTVLYAWKIARTPYLTAYGPETRDALATPVAVEPGSPVQLTAAVDDLLNGGQVVAGAEYYLLPLHAPVPPGDPGTGTPMLPADGAWTSPHEDVVATVDTSGYPAGRYLLAVRGMDVGGNWGPLETAFLFLLDPATAPAIEGYVRDAGTGAPLDAAVTAGLFTATTDPATGYYSMTVVSGTYDITAEAPYYAITTTHGVAARDGQITPQDLNLYPSCPLFADDMESGPGNWTTGGSPNTWNITTETYHSPVRSWSDSPWGSYMDNTDSWVRSSLLDLSGYGGINLSFWHKYQTEAGYDYCYVEYSTDGGDTWSLVASYDGNGGPWGQEAFDLPALDGQANVHLRFHFFSDDSTHGFDGWHFDDVLVAGGGPACPPLAAPVAGFTSTSPVILGQPMAFTNQSTANPLADFFWDFGDGIGTSTQVDPVYTYAAAGTFTVTLVATNVLGTDTVSHSVEVLPVPCDPVTQTAFTWTPLTPTVGEVVVFTGTATGTEPITYSWKLDVGSWKEGEIVTYTYAVPGGYAVVLTATNCATATAVVAHEIAVLPVPCDPVTQTAFTWTPLTPTVGEVVVFTGTATGTEPITYSWKLDVGSWKEGEIVTYTYAMPGGYAVVLTATNCTTATAAVTRTLTVLPPPCDPAQIVTITQGVSGCVVTLTAVVSGTEPFAYLWEAGTLTSTLPAPVFDFGASGTYTVALSVWNCGGAEPATRSFPVEVDCSRGYSIYLPIVLRAIPFK